MKKLLEGKKQLESRHGAKKEEMRQERRLGQSVQLI